MRRTSARSMGIVAVGFGAIAAVSLALLVPAGAGAAQTTPTTSTTAAPTLIEAICGRLPNLIGNVGLALPQAEDALTAARAAVDARREAMTTAMGELAAAVVDHLGVLDAKGDSTASGRALKAKQAQYVGAVVAWSKARTQLFDGEQQLVFGELQQTLLDSVNTNACP